MAKRKKLDLRPRYMQDLMRRTTFMGYEVTASGVVFNSQGRIIKPKFYFKGKSIDYVYIDVTYNGTKRRISYHRFVYMAWNKDFVDDPNFVITTIGRRFDYSIDNLKCITRAEHLRDLASAKQALSASEAEEVRATYEQVKDFMTVAALARRLGMTPRTLSRYLRGETDGV